MASHRNFRLGNGVAAFALATALMLGGCNRANEMTAEETRTAARLPDLPATLPLTAGDATPLAYAPAADALPDVAPVRAVRVADQGQRYAYADSAYDFTDALGDAPPDYAFDYGDVDPWAWQGYDDSSVFAEPIDDGYRYYYYRPGADAPYFVRDPDYGYGYDGGNLAVVYANDGAIVPWADYGPRIVYASRYLNRGRDLYRASRVRRQPVIAANWTARRPAILQSRRAWSQARAQQPGWANYRQRADVGTRNYWREESTRRTADARRFAGWQAQDFRTPPPPRAIPAAWQKASWARDERRFAPVREERRAVLAGRQDARQQAQARIADRRDGRARPDLARQRGPADDRDARQAQREQARAAQIAGRNERAQAGQAQQARQQREQTRAAQQAQRAAADQARQGQNAQRQQRAAQQAERAQANQARQAQTAQRGQREQQRAAQQAQRAQANQARQAQTAERGQREQQRAAQQAQRAQADQARQAQAAERGQREQQRAAQQAQRGQADQARAARQQEQAARQQQRAERGGGRDGRRGGPEQ